MACTVGTSVNVFPEVSICLICLIWLFVKRQFVTKCISTLGYYDITFSPNPFCFPCPLCMCVHFCYNMQFILVYNLCHTHTHNLAFTAFMSGVCAYPPSVSCQSGLQEMQQYYNSTTDFSAFIVHKPQSLVADPRPWHLESTRHSRVHCNSLGVLNDLSSVTHHQFHWPVIDWWVLNLESRVFNLPIINALRRTYYFI